MNDTQNTRLPSWAAPAPKAFFDLSQYADRKAFYLWIYASAFDMFGEFRDAVGPENVPGEGDGSGQIEDMSQRCPALFDFDGLAGERVSDSEQAWQEGIAACDKAIFDFLQTVEEEE